MGMCVFEFVTTMKYTATGLCFVYHVYVRMMYSTECTLCIEHANKVKFSWHLFCVNYVTNNVRLWIRERGSQGEDVWKRG